jgi:hypothetical protein
MRYDSLSVAAWLDKNGMRVEVQELEKLKLTAASDELIVRLSQKSEVAVIDNLAHYHEACPESESEDPAWIWWLIDRRKYYDFSKYLHNCPSRITQLVKE